jgi:hypothetical protein
LWFVVAVILVGGGMLLTAHFAHAGVICGGIERENLTQCWDPKDWDEPVAPYCKAHPDECDCEIKGEACAFFSEQTAKYHEWEKTHPYKISETHKQMDVCSTYGNQHGRAVRGLDPKTAEAGDADDWLYFCMQQARYHLVEGCEKNLPENLYHEECWSRAKLTILPTHRRELP